MHGIKALDDYKTVTNAGQRKSRGVPFITAAAAWLVRMQPSKLVSDRLNSFRKFLVLSYLSL
jgi:hypothetical protein